MDSLYKRFAFSVFIVALCFSTATPVIAKPAPHSVTVLDLSTQLQDKALIKRLYDGAVAEVRSYKSYSVLPKPQLDLAEMMLSLGCASMDVSCLAGIGAGVKVDQVMYIEIKPAGGQQLLTLTLVDVKAKKALKRVTRTVPTAQLFAGITALVQGALGQKVIPPKKSTRQQLHIATTPRGARVYLNQYYVGVSPVAGTYLKGTYVVRVTLSGHLEYIKKVVLGDNPVKLAVKLNPVAVAPVAKKKKKQTDGTVARTPFYKKWWFWTIIGVAAAAGTTAGVLFGTNAGRKAIGLGTSAQYGGVRISIHPNNISSDFTLK